MKKMTIEQINNILIDRNYGVKVIGGEYKNNNSKLVCKCNCGYEWTVTWMVLNVHSTKSKCPKCSGGVRIKSINEAQSILNDLNIDVLLLDKVYKNSKTKLRHRCNKCGYIGESIINILKTRSGCPSCETHMQNIDIEYAMSNVSIANKDVEILSDTYVGHQSKLITKCLICNHIWGITYSNLLRGRKCPECSKKTRHGKGGYNVKTAERNKEKWLFVDAIIYIINFFDEKESFIKVGITTSNVGTRFAKNKYCGYLMNTIKIIPTNLYDAIYIEEIIHVKNKEYSYRPAIKFDGYTECFSNIDLELIENIIQKYKTTD